MNEQNDALSNELNEAADTYNNAVDYMDAWSDETVKGTLDAEQSTLEYRRQLLMQLIKLNHTFDMIRVGLYAMLGISAEEEEDPSA